MEHEEDLNTDKFFGIIPISYPLLQGLLITLIPSIGAAAYSYIKESSTH
jgi:hypothetical protein